MMLSCLLANVDTNDGLLLSNHPSCVHFVVNEAKANAEATLCVIASTDGKTPLLSPQGVTKAFLCLILSCIKMVDR